MSRSWFVVLIRRPTPLDGRALVPVPALPEARRRGLRRRRTAGGPAPGARAGRRTLCNENPDADRLSAEADVRPDIDWRHFVAYAVFLAVALVSVEARLSADHRR